MRFNGSMRWISVVLVGAFGMVAVEAEAQRGRRANPEPAVKKEKVVRMTNVQYISMHRMAGCGLGSLAFDSDEKFNQVGASLLNATGMQSFAISFGTSNCTYDGITEASRERDAFVEANLADLNRDLARGNGEYALALASLYGCEGKAREMFVEELHAQAVRDQDFGRSPERFVDGVNAAVQANELLSLSCGG